MRNDGRKARPAWDRWLGFRMEILWQGVRIVTSPVRSIEIEAGSLHGPF